MTIADPYRGLEDGDAAGTRAWSAEQDALFAAARRDWPRRAAFREHLSRLYEVGLTGGAAERFEGIFDLGGHVRKVALTKLVGNHHRARSVREEVRSASASFNLTAVTGREYDPGHRGAWILGEQPEDRTAAPDFDVITMRAQTQDAQWPSGCLAKRDR